MTDRTIFGKPIRKSTTELFYPYKISLEEFVKVMKGVDGYANNMRNLGHQACKSRYVEEWFESFGAWSEIEEER